MIDHDLIREKRHGTWAFVTTFGSDAPEELEDTLRHVVDLVLPEARERPGWKGSLALAGEDRRRAVVVTLWDSVEATLSSGRALHALGTERGIAASSQRLEVVFEERAEEP